MKLLGAATSPRTPPTPAEHASTSSWIQAQEWKDDRKQLAHEELHKRIGLANRQRGVAQNAAKETGLSLAHKLGPGVHLGQPAAAGSPPRSINSSSRRVFMTST